MAEAVAIIGLLAAMGQLAEFSVALVSRLQNFMSAVDELPSCFGHLATQLPLLTSIVKSLRHRASSTWGHEISHDFQKDLGNLVAALERELQSIDFLLRKAIPAEDANSFERGMKALKSFKVQDRIEHHVDAVKGYINVLNTFLTFRSEEGIGILIRTMTDQSLVAEQAPTDTKVAHHQRDRIRMLDFEPDEHFVGRQDVLKEIDKRFEAGAQRVAIFGLGGVGKSRIATEYCHATLNAKPDLDVFWVRAATYEQFRASCQRIARLLKMRGWDDRDVDVLKLVQEHLSDASERPWLMVIDNADSHDVWLHSPDATADRSQALASYLPVGGDGRILITTRDGQLGRKLSQDKASPIAIGRLDEREAISLLRAKVDQGAHLDDADARELTSVLGNLPLTITQAAAYLNEIELSASEYLSSFRHGLSELPELLVESIDDPLRDRQASNSIFQTWRISFEHLLKHDARSADVLATMAMLDRQNVSKALLEQPGESPLQFKKATSKLKAFSFVDEDSDAGTFSMHHLVQLSTERWLEHRESTYIYQQQAIAAVARSCPPNGSFEAWSTLNELMPHLERILPYQSDSTTTKLHRASILHSFAHYYIHLGQETRALRILEEACQLRGDHLGPDQELTLSSRALLGTVYGAVGSKPLQEVADLLQNVIERSEKLLGASHRLTLKSRSRFAVIENKRNRLLDAKRMHSDILQTMEEVHGETDTDTLKEMSHLLHMHNTLQEWDQAHQLGNRALVLRKKVLGPKHPDTVTIMSQLCWTYNAQGRWDEASKLAEQVLDLRLDSLGADHPKTLVAMRNQVQAFRGLGRFEDAKQLQRYVVDSRKRTLGSDHRQTLVAVSQLSALEKRRKDGSRSSLPSVSTED